MATVFPPGALVFINGRNQSNGTNTLAVAFAAVSITGAMIFTPGRSPHQGAAGPRMEGNRYIGGSADT